MMTRKDLLEFPHICHGQCHDQNQQVGRVIPVISSLSFVPLKSAMWAKLQSSGLLETFRGHPLLSRLLRTPRWQHAVSPRAQMHIREMRVQKMEM